MLLPQALSPFDVAPGDKGRCFSYFAGRMNISNYLDSINKRFRTGMAREHAYRADLQGLLETYCKGISVINEPARIACGAPDLILNRGDIPVGYVEAKDIGVSLETKAHKDQFTRYKSSLDNLVFTDYLDFHFYRDGEFTTSIRIAEVKGGAIVPHPERFDAFTALLQDFAQHQSQTIRSPKRLAELMAGKARLLADVIEAAVESDEKSSANTDLQQQMKAFKDVLIHDIRPREFADLYAQTIAYGMFAARLHDTTLDTFSRQEAATLIPKSNPFLRKLFQNVAGYDLDSRIAWIVDLLADVFRATDVAAILKNFGRSTRQEDPMIHFYETFLAAYDPALRKARGVWYTPEPVVKFIVRAVDDLLKSEFGLKEGLADTSKTKIEVATQSADQRFKEGVKRTTVEVHKVQILDPATGTGTFLAEVVRHIHARFEGQQGIWSRYVEEHLLPRVNGFELLMASYAMAHLKLDLLLTESGYKPRKAADAPRLRVYLTNSLEEHHPDSGTLFTSWLSDEANQANAIKRDTPVMVVLGNPPYSGESANKGEWITGLMKDYKKEFTGEALKEKNSKWINNDYVKFIRFSEHFINKNGEGIIAFITDNSYLDSPTFRGMRYQLSQTFDSIYIVDLHGNGNKRETTPDGRPDKNVFDILQGVTVSIFVKTGKKPKGTTAVVNHFDCWGGREEKYKWLEAHSLEHINFQSLNLKEPQFYFQRTNDALIGEFEAGFSLKELFALSVLGYQSHRDQFAVAFSKEEMEYRLDELLDSNLSETKIRSKYGLKDSHDWQLEEAKRELIKQHSTRNITKTAYRPFDWRFCDLSYVSMDRPRKELIAHVLNRNNFCLNINRQTKMQSWQHAIVTDAPAPAVFVEIKDGSTVFPLYLYQQDLHSTSPRTPNLNEAIVEKIASGLGLSFTPEKEASPNTFAPIDLLDYIYAVLHSPAYRERYKEFLKIDFPRVPYPTDVEEFRRLVKLGGELRGLHLLESPAVNKFITGYPVDGSNEVEKPAYLPGEKSGTGRVYINETQYFEGVPETAWAFYIGGYQPAQKWLKDRRGRELSFDDILHYQQIIEALTETARIMQAIDAA